MKIKSFFSQYLPVIISAIILTVCLAYAWTPPSSSPPSGNVSAPINTGAMSQSKTGDLNIGGGLKYWITKLGDSFALKNNLGQIKFIVGQDGNIGIGKNDPDAKLHVNGRIKALDPVDDDDVATKAYVDAQVGASIPIVRFTEALYKGNLGGVAGADAKCRAEFGPSFHFCDCWKALGAMPGVSAIIGGWCNYSSINNCNNWTRSFYLSVTDVGQIIYLSSGFWQCGAGPSISQSRCDSSNRLVCCNW